MKTPQFRADEITDESAVRLLLAKTGIDNQLAAVAPDDTALFGAHGPDDSLVVLQHQRTISVWQLFGPLPNRLGFKQELQDKLKDMQDGKIKPGDNVEYFRQRWGINGSERP